ncbi:MAG: DNA-processing protein DprA [Gammaproteobacteria bacterium]|nr:DNA-processing protein DprA [Gammaproteobacteria bacterium]
MIPEHQLDWLKLTLVPGLGPAGIQKLLEGFGTPEAISAAPETQLAATTGLSSDLCRAIKTVDHKRLEQSISWLEASANHHLLCIDDPQYPALLKAIHDAPPVLFVNGNITLLSQLQLAMVGSRNPSSSGYETAYEFARHLANTGLVITSGLALGIDGASHQGALDAGGQTIAVTGNGLDRVYPARHRNLAHQIAEHGALVTEFPPGTKPLPGNFPRRNRIIAGLSLGTLVVEAAQKSGSLITAYRALEQSREVFAIPGSIHNPLAKGCHQLIRQGAKLIETAQDILEELSPIAQASFEIGEQPDETPDPCTETSESHLIILEAMAYDPVNIDTLISRTGMASNAISSILLILELEGKVASQPGGHYIRSISAK